MNRQLRIVLPLIVLLGGALIANWLLATGPKPKKVQARATLPAVEVMQLKTERVQIHIPSQGSVVPVTRSTLVAETAGRILYLSPAFSDGGFFSQGDLLLRLDDRDYRNALTIAKAELAEIRLTLAEEKARAQQAAREWQRSGIEGDAEPLVLRQPQLKATRARVAAAQAKVAQAELDLERTQVVAPFNGRVLTRKVGPGQYLNRGSILAEIYASDQVEVRLPLSDDQLGWLDLTSIDSPTPQAEPIRVEFSVRNGDRQETWSGILVRSEASLAVESRQLSVIARIDNPYRPADGRLPLRIGQFLEARISGRTLDNAYVLPRAAVRGADQIMLVNDQDRLHRQQVKILWREAERVIIAGPLPASERLVLTPLPYAADGAKVQILAAASADSKAVGRP